MKKFIATLLNGSQNIRNAIFMVLFLTTFFSSYGQQSKPTTGKKANSAIPDFTIYTIKDSTEFSSKSLPKNGIVLIKYFSVDCSHCQDEAKLFLSKKDSIQNIKTVWISGSWAELRLIKKFAEKYKLAELNPITIGKETGSFLLSYYKITGLPFAAVYKDNKLIKEYVGAIDFEELIAINNGKFKTESEKE